MRILTFLVAAFVAASSLSAQNDIRYCGQTEQTEALFARYPQLRHASETAEERATHVSRLQEDEVYIIPIVFHIIHDNGSENISNEQILDALQILNHDMRKQNADTLQIVDEFADLAADTHIEFRLAQLDPNGNCTNGINRIQSPLTYQGDQEMKGLIMWPRDMYLNVWVCADANGAAGYSQLPGNVDGFWGQFTDGIVMRDDYTGSIGTSNNTRSRALTHEVGHWLNLYHTWGQGNSPGDGDNCDMDDQVPDTPETLGWTSCSITGETCGSLDNIQNYMEYSYCSRMFTVGQADRMLDALTSSTADRNELWQPDNLNDTGVLNEVPVLCQANFTVNRTVACIGDSLQFTDYSFNNPTEWTWEFGDGTVLSGGEEVSNPSYAFSEPGTYSVTLTVGNGIDEVSTTEDALITVLPSGSMDAAIEEGFEDNSWENTWYVINPTGGQGWDDVGAAAFSGDRCIRLSNNFTNDVDEYDWFESAPFDASEATSVIITYKYSYINRVQETDDRLRIKVSGDCGQNWSTRELHRGFTDLPTGSPSNISWVPSSTSDWTSGTVVVDQAQFLTSGFRVMFEFQAKGGNNIYLDDINIEAQFPVGVTELSAASANALLFPNPTSGQTTIRLNSEVNDNATVRIVDGAGRVVWQKAQWAVIAGQQDLVLPTAELPAGWYSVQVSGEEVHVRAALLKQ